MEEFGLINDYSDRDRRRHIAAHRKLRVEPFRLNQRTRKSVQNVAGMNIILSESQSHHVIHETVWNELALIHQALCSVAELSALSYVGAQDISSGDLRDAVSGHQELRLCTLAYAGCAQKENWPGQEVLVCGGRLGY